MSRPLMRAISADAMLRRAGAAVARHPPPQKSANFCRLFGVWRRGGRRRAGNIPASDPDTARRPSAVSRAMPSQTLLGRRGSRAATGAIGEGNEPPWLWGVEISHTEGPVLLNFALDGIDNPAGWIHFERLGGSARSPPQVEMIVSVGEFLSGAERQR